jgi:ribosomal protein S14
MKKLLTKDKILRKHFEFVEKQHFILKSISKNFNFFILMRWNALLKLKKLKSKNKIINRCVISINKKRFNKLTNFSRHIFLKQIRFGQINGLRKTSW